MKLLFVASEMAPYAKTGGLADVMGALPMTMARGGHDVRVVMPLYDSVDTKKATFEAVGDFGVPRIGQTSGVHTVGVGRRFLGRG